MERLKVWILGLAFTVFLCFDGWGCSTAGGPGTYQGERLGAVPNVSARVWPTEEDLKLLAIAASDRIYRSSGLRIEVVDNINNSVPLFWTDQGTDDGWNGVHHADNSSHILALDVSVQDWMQETIVTHELMHLLGTPHVQEAPGYLMSARTTDAFPITDRDLTALCAVRSCVVFNPEFP